jgi:putative transposase
VVDVIVVDEEHRRPIGRPVLTVAIDVCTRMVAGFYLSLDPPSTSSVGLCLLHAVYDKSAWLGGRGLDLDWPVAGLPRILHCDNVLCGEAAAALGQQISAHRVVGSAL